MTNILSILCVVIGLAIGLAIWLAFELKSAPLMPDCYDSEECIGDCKHCIYSTRAGYPAT